MSCEKVLLVLVLFVGDLFLVKEGFAHNTKRHRILCSEVEASIHPETGKRRPYSTLVSANKRQNTNAIKTESRGRYIDQRIIGKITKKRRKGRSRTGPSNELENIGSTSQHTQDPKLHRASLKHLGNPRHQNSAGKEDETRIQLKAKDQSALTSPGSNAKPVLSNGRAIQLLEKRAFVSTPPLDNGKISEHDIHLSETILSALKLLLDKRNSFRNDSEALRLASVLLMKNDDKSHPKVVKMLSSEMKRPIPATNNKTFIAGVLSGPNATRGSLSSRKSSIITDLVNPTDLGVSILRIMFGTKASLVTKPKYKNLFDRVSAKSTDSQSVRNDSDSFQWNNFPARSALRRIRGEGLEPKLRPGRVHSSPRDSHEIPFNLAKTFSQLIANLNRRHLKQRSKGQPVFHKALPTSSNILRVPPKINVDVNGRRKSWVLLKIPKGKDALESSYPLPDKSDSNSADSNNRDVSITGKVRPQVTTSELQSDIPKSNTNLNEISQDLSKAQQDGLSESSVSSKIQNENTASQTDQSAGITQTLVQTVQTDVKGGRKSWVLLKIPKGKDVVESDYPLPDKSDSNSAGDVSITGKIRPQITTSELQSDIPKTNPNLNEISQDLSKAQQDGLSESSVSSKIQNENTASKADQSAGITQKLVQTVQTFLKALKSSIKALQSNKLASSNRVSMLEPKSSRPTASIPATAGVQSTASLVPSRIRDPLREVPIQDESITVPSPSATGTKPGIDENVLFQSDTVFGATGGATDTSKIKEDLEAFAEKGLQAHNRFRTLHHAPILHWSDELANEAEKLAYEMAMKGVMTRSDAVKSMGEGENIAKISRVPFEEAGTAAAEVWYSERKNYSFSYPRLDDDNDAFTQMVWKNTKELGMGCAKDLQTNDMYVVALYRPAGNNKIRLRANVLKDGEVGRDVYATIFKKDRAEKALR